MSKARILYIEDNPDNMILVQRVLMVEGYEVIEATNGIEGVARAKEILPDIVITDINLPDIDGYEITHRLKTYNATAHIPVVAMTANVMKKDRENVEQAGCDGYISKPIDIDELPKQIEDFIKKGKA
ncbi:response regulator [Anaerolineales bacterium HSG24]|nr:response regulator [Anaerolineales bacterium HSG24]